MRHQWVQETPCMLSGREMARIDNHIRQRAVTGWTLVGASYRRGHRIPGGVRLELEGGGYIWYAENTPLMMAVADADDRGYSTAAVREQIAEWVRTGNGASFDLKG